MTLRARHSEAVQVGELEGKTYAPRVKRAGKLADRALRRFGEPNMELEELRVAVDRELSAVSLSGFVLKERDTRW